MSATSSDDPRPFFTVIAWPDGENRDQVAERLARATGLAFADLRHRLGQAPPMIVGQLEPDAAARGCRALVDAGGDAFAPRLADLLALGPTLKIKDLRLEHGVLVLDLWRGPVCTVEREAVQILVRAHLRTEEIRREGPLTFPPGVLPSGSSIALAHSLKYASLGLAAAYAPGYIANRGDELAGINRMAKTSDKLDVHTSDGRVFQIDGDKFGYTILGDLRGHSDKANMDAMCELLSHLAPDEIVDPYFSLWHPPPGHNRLRLPLRQVNNDDPAFAFYSRWAALMYRHVMADD